MRKEEEYQEELRLERKEAREEGLKEGREEGREEGIELGRIRTKKIFKLYSQGMTEEQIADELGLPLEEVIDTISD